MRKIVLVKRKVNKNVNNKIQIIKIFTSKNKKVNLIKVKK